MRPRQPAQALAPAPKVAILMCEDHNEEAAYGQLTTRDRLYIAKFAGLFRMRIPVADSDDRDR